MKSFLFCQYPDASFPISTIIIIQIGAVIMKLTNPKICLIISEIGICALISGFVWLIQDIAIKELSWIWGFAVGIFLGFFYPSENV